MNEEVQYTEVERAVLTKLLDIYQQYYKRHQRNRFELLKYGMIDVFNSLAALYKEDPEFYNGLVSGRNYTRLIKAGREYYLDFLRTPSNGEREAALLASSHSPNLEIYLSKMKGDYPLFADYRAVRHYYAEKVMRKSQKVAN